VTNHVLAGGLFRSQKDRGTNSTWSSALLSVRNGSADRGWFERGGMPELGPQPHADGGPGSGSRQGHAFREAGPGRGRQDQRKRFGHGFRLVLVVRWERFKTALEKKFKKASRSTCSAF